MEDSVTCGRHNSMKVPQGKKTLESWQSRPAKRGEEWGNSPVAGTVGPLPRPESRGNAQPDSEQERKRHCADRDGSFLPQFPGRVENLPILSLDFSR